MAQLSDRELATVLASLRVFQSWTGKRTYSTTEYFTDHEPLNLEEIDELCERLNTTSVHAKDCPKAIISSAECLRDHQDKLEEQELDDEERARRGAANRLRDAAPELLEALGSLVGTGAQHELECDLSEHGPREEDQCIWCDARAALAKAEEGPR